MVEAFNRRESVQQGVNLVEGLARPTNLTELKMLVLDLAFQTSPETERQTGPPAWINHVFQVGALSGAMLIDQIPEIQIQGQYYAQTHDIGRTVTLSSDHTIVGARMLQIMGFEDCYVLLALAHHRWGLGLPVLGQNHPEQVRNGLVNGEIRLLYDQIKKRFGLAALAVLLADNSKSTPDPNTFEPVITPFTESLGYQLIQAQIDKGRYESDSYQHGVEILGMRFLLKIIPYLENDLGIKYIDVVNKTKKYWEREVTQLKIKWLVNHR